MSTNYWTRLLRNRVSRRRALAASGASALSAAFLAACGGGNDDGAATSTGGTGGAGAAGTTGETSSGFVSTLSDTTSEAVPGGTMVSSFRKEVSHLDAGIVSSTATLGVLLYNYSNLVKAGLSTTPTRPGAAEVTGDALVSWEFSPDLLTFTGKVRPDHKFDPRPPANGRAMTSDDVLFSWGRFVELGANAGALSNERSPDGPVTTLEAPDDSTIVAQQSFPFALLTEALAVSKGFYIQPRVDDSFNFKADMLGSGPYFLEDYREGEGFVWVKNPGWYEPNQPFHDRIERHLFSDYTAELAQFESGALDTMEVLPTDILRVKKDHPDMLMSIEPGLDTSAHPISFSYLPDSVFKDVRVRKALSMTLDRGLLINAIQNVDTFEAEGIPVEAFWHSHLSAAHAEWVDPLGDGLGEGAAFFQYNLEEARKLLEAAGVPIPLEANYTYFTDRPTPDVQAHEAFRAMMDQSGLFTMTPEVLQYDTSWRTAEESRGEGYSGVLANVSSSTSADSQLTQLYTPEGRNALWPEPIPGVTELILKQRSEPDKAVRAEIIAEIQVNLAKEWPCIMWPGTSTMLTIRHPWLRNHGVFNEGDPTAKQVTRWWHDASKKA